MSTEYEKFTEHMRKQDAKLPIEKSSVSIGVKDENGNLLILGGWKANLWRLRDGLFAVGEDRTVAADYAIELYNFYNGSKLPVDYIQTVFEPWYEKQYIIVAKVPSRTNPRKSYNVTRSPEGELICDPKCRGFKFYGYCWHTEAVKELTSD